MILILIDMCFSGSNRSKMNGYIMSLTSALAYFVPVIAGKIFSGMDNHSLGVLFWWLMVAFTAGVYVHSRVLKN
ncbi:unnamed protein product [Ambrosiozyma monospora]|nr:unnamed protein product [Ambrosiozyma monospora]